MSFLLNIGKSNRAERPPLPPPAATDPTTTGLRGGSGQTQLLVQRPDNATMSAQAASQTTVQKQDGINMLEVMEDLKVLEKQQKEAAQKLADVKASKQQRQQKRSELEHSLEDYKYSNGEKRAQLQRVRELLNASLASLSSRRLRADSTEKDISSIDAKLKKGLAAARTNNEIRRKIDSELLTLKSKLAIVLQLKNSASSHLSQLERRCEQSKLGLENNRRDLKDEIVKVSDVTKQVSDTRRLQSELENNLASAKQTEARSRYRVDAIDRAIQAEGSSSQETMRVLVATMAAYTATKRENEEMTKQLQAEIQAAKQETHKMRLQAVKIQKQFEPDSGSSNDADAISEEAIREVDLEVISKAAAELLNKEEGALSSDRAARETAKVAIAALKLEVDRAQEQESELTAAARETTASACSLLATQVERQKEMKALAEKRDRAASDVQKLHSSLHELSGRQAGCRQKAENESDARKRCISAKSKELKKIRNELETLSSSIPSLKESWAKEQRKLQAESREAKARFQEGNVRFESLSEKMEEDDMSELQSNHQYIENATKADEDRIQLFLCTYPELSNIEYAYSPEKTLEEQMEICLEGLNRTCRQRIKAAQKVHSEKVEAERKRVERKKREIADLERKKAEELSLQVRGDAEQERRDASLELSSNSDISLASPLRKESKNRPKSGYGEKSYGSIPLEKPSGTDMRVKENSSRRLSAEPARRVRESDMSLSAKNADPRGPGNRRNHRSSKSSGILGPVGMGASPKREATSKKFRGGVPLSLGGSASYMAAGGDGSGSGGGSGTVAAMGEISIKHAKSTQDRKVRWFEDATEGELDEPKKAKSKKTSRRYSEEASPSSATTIKTVNAKSHSQQSKIQKKSSEGSTEMRANSFELVSTSRPDIVSKKSGSKSSSRRNADTSPTRKSGPKKNDSHAVSVKARVDPTSQYRSAMKTKSKNGKDSRERRDPTSKGPQKRRNQDMSSLLSKKSANDLSRKAPKRPKIAKNAKKKKAANILGAKASESSKFASGLDFSFSFR